MSYRMPFPDPFLPTILIVVCLGAGTTWIARQLASSSANQVHTDLALVQVAEFLSTRSKDEMPTNTTDLITVLRSASIDWNSCSINSGGLTDSWGSPIRMTFDEKNTRWTFLSSGKDRRFDTPDDIQEHTQTTSEQVIPPNAR